MKIGVNARFLLKNNLEGVGKFTVETMRRIVQKHPEHEFVFFFDRPYDESFIFSNNITPVVINPPARHPILFYLWFEWSLPAALKKHNVDVLVSPDGFTSLKTKIPTVLVLHDIAFMHYPDYLTKAQVKYYKKYTPKFVEHARHIATVSEFSKQDILRHYDIPAEKVEVIYNGADEIYQPIDSQEQKDQIKARYAQGMDYFIYVGAIHPRKNVARLVKAFERFKQNTQSNFKLLLVGRMAWQTEDVEQAIAQSNYKNDIVLTGYVPESILPALIGSAFAMVYVSLFEGFGMPILEAMQCNVPVITSNASSMPEVLGDAGLMVDPQSVEAIADAMQQLTSSDTLRETLIEEGYWQQQCFSWDATAKRLWKLIKEAANAPQL